MSEDQELLARIGQLAGHINLHKHQAPVHHEKYARSAVSDPKFTQATRYNASSWRTPRANPYPRTRGQTGKIIRKPHRNRTLILNNGKPQDRDSDNPALQDTHSMSNESNDEHNATGWVSKRDRHLQLFNSAVYSKESQIRVRAIEQTRKKEADRKDRNEQSKITKHLWNLNAQAGRSSTGLVTTAPIDHQLYVNGIRFRVVNGGSKLSRIFDGSDTARSTPKQTNIGGVKFHRSKNGNLYRSGVVKANRKAARTKKTDQPCKRFTITGRCQDGISCRYTHDPEKVAMCKDYLQKGICPAGDACDLSHKPTAERVPACLHFLRGKCSNLSCRYAHIRVNPSAPVCKDFAVLGFCGKGADCTERHVHECPDYANTGVCYNKKCRLPHVDRAGQLRKRAVDNPDINLNSRNGNSVDDDDEESDVASDDEHYDEIDSDDIDSEGLSEDMVQLSDSPDDLRLTQQQDFLPF